MASALGKFVSGIGQGLINFIKGITPIVSPTLESLINGTGKAFEFMAKVLNAIPESMLSGLTTAFLSFFAAFKTYEMVVKAGGLITAFANNIKFFGSLLPGIVNSGPILQNLASALGPSALGGIAFTVIAGGLLLIAQRIMRVTDEAAKSSAIGQFSQALSDLNDEVSQKTNQINTSLDNTRNAVETAGVAEAQAARDLAKEYNELSDKASLSAGEKERLKQVSSDLIDIIPDLKGYINEETGVLDIQKESLDAVIQGYESLAQKQAAQGYLVQAYKDQYEAQMNSKHAEDELNNATDEYLKKAGLTKKALDDIKSGYLSVDKIKTGMGATTLNGEILNVEDYGFKANEVGAFVKAIGELEKVYGEYNETLKEAQETERKAGEEINFINDIIDENTQKEKKSIETKKADTLASNEYKQSLRDLNTEFSNLDLTLSDDFMQKLVLDENFDITPIQEFFKSLANGVQASGSEVQSAFESLGLSLPKELANAIAKMEPEAQAEVTKMLMQIKSGAEVQTPEIKSLFEKIGYDLPDAIVKNFSEREPTVQNSTIDLLAGIQNGHSLTEGNLIKLFAGLGVKVPEALIEQLGDSKTSAEVQAKAVELLAQISSAEESERPGLIEKLKTLGIDGADSLAEGIKSGQSTVETETKNLAGVAKTTMNNEFNPNDKGVGSLYDAGANASKGFWQGMKDWWDDSWLGRKVDELKETVTGKKGLDEHSPSKIMGQYGAFAGIGFNNKFSAEMDKTVPMIERWIDSMKSTLSGYHIALPGSNFTYTLGNDLLNQYAMALQVSLPSFNAGSISMDYTAELTASLKGSNAELLYELRRNNDLLEQLVEKPVIDENGIYNATRRGVSRHFAQTGKTGFKGID